MRTTHVLRRMRAEGPRGLAQRVVRRAYQRVGASVLDETLLPKDVADSARLALAPGRTRTDDGPLAVGWVCTPPALGSGGHTTMFRMIAALEEAGHRCTVLLYDRHHGSTRSAEAVIREGWPQVRASVRSVDDGFAGLDACVATGWESAHVLARRGDAPLHRFYFVQDYEPWFYPRGSRHELAMDSYRFGFTIIALGHSVQDQLRTDLGVDSWCVPFSCDGSVYHLQQPETRSGVVFYVKPEVPRRGAVHGLVALTEFHERHPDHEIHLFGSPAVDLPFPAVQHGRMVPADLNLLYNRCAAGLALSFTNITLVAEEMLAAGCLAVVNDFPGARENLPHPGLVWTDSTPGSLADGLSRAVLKAAEPGLPAQLARDVRTDAWSDTGRMVVEIVEKQVRCGTTAVEDDATVEEQR